MNEPSDDTFTDTSTTRASERHTRRALVLDASPYHQVTLRHLLQPLGIDATTISHATGAIGAMVANEFDVLFIDCDLHDRSGFSLANALEKFEYAIGQPFVVGTSRVMSDQMLADCFASGMHGFLLKPYRWDLLCEALKESPLLPVPLPPGPTKAVASLAGLRLMAGGNKERFEQLLSDLIEGFENDARALSGACYAQNRKSALEIGHRLLSLTPVIECEAFAAAVQTAIAVAEEQPCDELVGIAELLARESSMVAAYLRAALAHYRTTQNPFPGQSA